MCPDYETARVVDAAFPDIHGEYRAVEAQNAEAALTKVREELEHEQQTSLDDPAEQRAERYAMEAYELAGKLIKAEASLASYAEGAREIAEEMLAATDNAAIAAREGWAEAILALGPRS